MATEYQRRRLTRPLTEQVLAGVPHGELVQKANFRVVFIAGSSGWRQWMATADRRVGSASLDLGACNGLPHTPADKGFTPLRRRLKERAE